MFFSFYQARAPPPAPFSPFYIRPLDPVHRPPPDAPALV